TATTRSRVGCPAASRSQAPAWERNNARLLPRSAARTRDCFTLDRFLVANPKNRGVQYSHLLFSRHSPQQCDRSGTSSPPLVFTASSPRRPRPECLRRSPQVGPPPTITRPMASHLPSNLQCHFWKEFHSSSPRSCSLLGSFRACGICSA